VVVAQRRRDSEQRREGLPGSVLITGCLLCVLGILAAVVFAGDHRLLVLGIVVTLVAVIGLIAYLVVDVLIRR
jgi:hypothetical protein